MGLACKCKWCKRVFAGIDGGNSSAVRRRPTGAECTTCCAVIRSDPEPYKTPELRDAKLSEMEADSDKQAAWDAEVAKKDGMKTKNGKDGKVASAASSPGGPGTPIATPLKKKTKRSRSRGRSRSSDAQSASTRGRSRTRRPVNLSSDSDGDEQITRDRSSSIVGQQLLGVFWSNNSVKKKFAKKKAPKAIRKFRYNGEDGVGVY